MTLSAVHPNDHQSSWTSQINVDFRVPPEQPEGKAA